MGGERGLRRKCPVLFAKWRSGGDPNCNCAKSAFLASSPDAASLLPWRVLGARHLCSIKTSPMPPKRHTPQSPRPYRASGFVLWRNCDPRCHCVMSALQQQRSVARWRLWRRKGDHRPGTDGLPFTTRSVRQSGERRRLPRGDIWPCFRAWYDRAVFERPQIASFLVNLRGLRPPHRMSTVGTAIQANAGGPSMDDTGRCSDLSRRLGER